MFIGDEREIIHLAPAWPLVFAAYLWIWLSLTVTVLAVREQLRRQQQPRPAEKEKEISDYKNRKDKLWKLPL